MHPPETPAATAAMPLASRERTRAIWWLPLAASVVFVAAVAALAQY